MQQMNKKESNIPIYNQFRSEDTLIDFFMG